MIKVSLLLLVTTISISSFSQQQDKKFEIIGNVSGFPDSTYIQLFDFSSGSNDLLMDSAQIINSKFTFKGTINKEYQSVGLICQRNIKVFWIERGIIHFDAEKGKFCDAVITGSSMQDEASQLNALI